MSTITTDVGENFEYAKTIIQNRLELKKIELMEHSSELLGTLFLVVSLFVFGLFAFICLMVIMIIWLSNLLDSTILALCIVAGVMALISIFIFAFRKSLLYVPVAKLFYRKVLKN